MSRGHRGYGRVKVAAFKVRINDIIIVYIPLLCLLKVCYVDPFLDEKQSEIR